MKRSFIFTKIFIAAIIAFVVLNLFSFFWRNPALTLTPSEDTFVGAHKKDTFYCKFTEGFAWGRTDSNGFNNIGKSASGSDVNILMLGSSHMQGYNVAQNENTAYYLEKISKMNTYNIGESGSRFENCISILDDAIKKFKPTDYVIMEISHIPTTKDLDTVLSNTLTASELTKNSSASIADTVLNQLKNFPYLRHMFVNLTELTNDNNKPNNPDLTFDAEKYNQKLYKIFEQKNELLNKNNLEFIIIYHTHLKIDACGEISPREYDKEYDLFATACEQNNIHFVDPYNYFVNTYNQCKQLPHGFSNTKVGTGHLNKYGHLSMANALYDAIKTEEQK